VVATAPREPLTPPDFRAAYLRNPPPGYPAAARRNGEEGTVTLRVLVSVEGAPRDVLLERSSGSGLLDAAALAAVKNWRFAPARRGGEAREAWVLVPIVFRLEPRS
jgi:protein TonB